MWNEALFVELKVPWDAVEIVLLENIIAFYSNEPQTSSE